MNFYITDLVQSIVYSGPVNLRRETEYFSLQIGAVERPFARVATRASEQNLRELAPLLHTFDSAEFLQVSQTDEIVSQI